MTLEQRVMRLERSCRRWRVACIGMALIAVALGAGPNPAPPLPDGNFANLTADHLTIKNAAGGPALDVSADAGQASLQINNPANGTSAILVVNKDGANLLLNRIAPKGGSSASLDVDNVSGSVVLRDAAGKTKDVEP